MTIFAISVIGMRLGLWMNPRARKVSGPKLRLLIHFVGCLFASLPFCFVLAIALGDDLLFPWKTYALVVSGSALNYTLDYYVELHKLKTKVST
ncbi:MAG: hypothetical protein CMJ78_17205 [Planctomycetaceae bacterium]|nr:hypothetical protein [Planctomycetaceae bacterium]